MISKRSAEECRTVFAAPITTMFVTILGETWNKEAAVEWKVTDQKMVGVIRSSSHTVP